MGVGDLQRVAADYFGRMLDASSGVVSVCCSPGRTQEVKAELER